MILLTGGSGLLGRNLVPLLKDCYAPVHSAFDILRPVLPAHCDIDLIVHCAAYTDVVKAEGREAEACALLNVGGTRNVAQLGKPLVYISTEYVFNGAAGDYEEDALPG